MLKKIQRLKKNLLYNFAADHTVKLPPPLYPLPLLCPVNQWYLLTFEPPTNQRRVTSWLSNLSSNERAGFPWFGQVSTI